MYVNLSSTSYEKTRTDVNTFCVKYSLVECFQGVVS